MPTYTFENTQTGEVTEEFMSISKLDEYLAANPHLKTIITQAPPIGDPHLLGRKKPDAGFRDVLKNIKSKHKRSNINTW